MQKIIEKLPSHLKKYVVDQNYEKYTPEDQAVWRYIMLQLRSFLSQYAHPCYLEGLEKTGITTNEIPKIENVNDKLSAFGWGAIPVSGFIPPAAFMEFQSLGILPIASDMRSIDHILYTPAPDIVHEAAGHAPILINEQFAEYLKRYAEIARKAIISKQDMDQYEAIRILSDVKENPDSTKEQIALAEKNLEKVTAAITEISEAAWLSRMNWWTAEYGLIGTLENPRIFGAGLLSSVGEARECLSNKVKKIPLTVNCVETGYDITEPQPQLFVTPDFKNLHQVLDDLADRLAFRKGGVYGLEKAKSAKTVNSVELETGVQISGILDRYDLNENAEPIFLKMSGPCQLSHLEKQLINHGPEYHSHGYSSPLGRFNGWEGDLENLDLPSVGIFKGEITTLTYQSGIVVTGLVTDIEYVEGAPAIVRFENCSVKKDEEILFAPDWGSFDLVIGCSVTSVFGGPADRSKYEGGEDFVTAKVPSRTVTDKDKMDFEMFSDVRTARESQKKSRDVLEKLTDKWTHTPGKSWLVGLELVEIGKEILDSDPIIEKIKKEVENLSDKDGLKHFNDGLRVLNEVTQ